MSAPERTEAAMQYKAPETPAEQATRAEDAKEGEEQQSPLKKTILGMRGGGIILDLCACFICCECMEGCCHAIDDCCCC